MLAVRRTKDRKGTVDMMRKFGMLFAVLAVLVAGLPVPAQAAPPTPTMVGGAHWDTKYVNNVFTPKYLAFHNGMGSSFDASFATAVSTWAGTTTDLVPFVADLTDYTYIDPDYDDPCALAVSEIPNDWIILCDGGDLFEDAIGQAVPKSYTNNHLTAFQILVDHAYWTNVPAGRYGIVLHEMGHSLGLGHSVNTSDIMYPTMEGGSVTADDTAGIHGGVVHDPGFHYPTEGGYDYYHDGVWLEHRLSSCNAGTGICTLHAGIGKFGDPAGNTAKTIYVLGCTNPSDVPAHYSGYSGGTPAGCAWAASASGSGSHVDTTITVYPDRYAILYGWDGHFALWMQTDVY